VAGAAGAGVSTIFLAQVAPAAYTAPQVSLDNSTPGASRGRKTTGLLSGTTAGLPN